MELNEKLDAEYKNDKSAMEKMGKLRDEVKALLEDQKFLRRKIFDIKVKIQRAIEDKDKDVEKGAKDELKVEENNAIELGKKIKNIQNVLGKNEDKVNSYIEKLKEDPEFAPQINSILEKKFSRKIKKTKKDKANVDMLIDICSKHPSVANNLKGMISAKNALRELNDELKKLDPVKDRDRINAIVNIEKPKFEKKEKMNEGKFKEFCEKNGVDISQEWMSGFIEENGFASNKGTGEINLNKTLKKLSKGYDKRIELYKEAISMVPGARIENENRETPDKLEEREENIPEELKKSIGNDLNRYIFNDNTIEEPVLPAPKFKWYQFGKRFSAWREARKAMKLEIENAETEPKAKHEEELKDSRNPSSKFKNAYQYEIVGDYLKNEEKRLLEEAGKNMKNRPDEEERD